MRLLHARHDHDRREHEPVAAARPRLGAQGQHLPLHRLWRDRSCAARRAGDRAGRGRRRLRPQRAGAGGARRHQRRRALHAWTSRRPGCLHLKLLRSPHAHARITSIRTRRGAGRPRRARRADLRGRAAEIVLHARGTRTNAPIRTIPRVLDSIVRFVGQRVAAVVADSEAAAEEGCRKLAVDYELLPAVFDPEEAMRPGAPVIHDKGPESRIHNPQRNIAGELHGHVGDVDAGFAEADVVYEGTYITQRVQHAHLETHCAIGWLDQAGRLNIRSSTQTPYLTRRALAGTVRPRSGQGPRVLRAHGRRLRRQAGNAGRGHRRACRAQDRAAGQARIHPRGAVHRRHHAPSHARAHQGRRAPRRLASPPWRCTSSPTPAPTAITASPCSTTPAARCFGVYRCANKKIDGFAVYTNTVPSGAFRGYGLPQTNFAVESAMDELARRLGIDPFEFRERNIVRPGDPMVSTGAEEGHDVRVWQLRPRPVPRFGQGRARSRRRASSRRRPTTGWSGRASRSA